MSYASMPLVQIRADIKEGNQNDKVTHHLIVAYRSMLHEFIIQLLLIHRLCNFEQMGLIVY